MNRKRFLKNSLFLFFNSFFLTLLIPITSIIASEVKSIHILAAANTHRVLEDIKSRYIKLNPKAQIFISYASSGSAYAQIKNQAPIDLFISADLFYPQKLYEEGLADKPIIYAQGVLVLLSKTMQIQSIKDVLKGKNISIANPNLAPYGRAAKEVLQNLDFLKKISTSIRLAASISQVHQWIDTKNSDIGFGALSLVEKNNIHVLKIDPSLYSPIQQALVLTKKGSQNPLAQDFTRFLLHSKDLFKKYGYITQK